MKTSTPYLALLAASALFTGYTVMQDIAVVNGNVAAQAPPIGSQPPTARKAVIGGTLVNIYVNADGTGHIQLAQPADDGVRIDIHYRMLHWRELAAATSFDDEGDVYDFAGTGTEITKQIGNAVPCRMGKALVRALMEDA